MTWLSRLLRRNRMERLLDKELRFHLEQHTADLIARGQDPAGARRQAGLELGGYEQVKEECRDARGTRWRDRTVSPTTDTPASSTHTVSVGRSRRSVMPNTCIPIAKQAMAPVARSRVTQNQRFTVERSRSGARATVTHSTVCAIAPGRVLPGVGTPQATKSCRIPSRARPRRAPLVPRSSRFGAKVISHGRYLVFQMAEVDGSSARNVTAAIRSRSTSSISS